MKGIDVSEHNGTIKVKTRQRNMWIAISGLLAGVDIAGR